METEHSPTPYTASIARHAEGQPAFGFTIEAADDSDRWHPVASCGVYHRTNNACYTPEELEANAAFIVKACNAHAAMVEALDPEMLEAIADEIECHEHSARSESLRIIARRQRAALALAKAGA